MSKIYLKTYGWLLRGLVEFLSLFPPRRMNKEELLLRKGAGTDSCSAAKKIWIHSASLGEAITLRPFISKLVDIYGRDKILCTSTTMDGLNQLRKDELCGYATLLPIELPEIVNSFITRFNPEVLLISETEIWPLLLANLANKKIPYHIINARINEKTVRLMKLFWPLFKTSVENIGHVFVQEAHYKRRFKILGVPSSKISLAGCFKYDSLDSKPDTSELRNALFLPNNRKLICFGSTHPDEEEQILSALKPHWQNIDLTAIIAPRHITRIPQLEALFKKHSIDYERLSQLKAVPPRLILVDKLGILKNLYAISDLAFVGGSLIKHGGHNLMEPISLSVPVITGKHTFNFRYEVMRLKKSNAISIVHDSTELSEAISKWYTAPEEFNEMAIRAKALLDDLTGATSNTIKKLREMKLLPPT